MLSRLEITLNAKIDTCIYKLSSKENNCVREKYQQMFKVSLQPEEASVTLTRAVSLSVNSS